MENKYVELYVDSRDSSSPLAYISGSSTQSATTRTNAGQQGTTDVVACNIPYITNGSTAITLIDAQVPFSFYTLNSSFTSASPSGAVPCLTVKATGSGTVYQVGIAPGNYTSDELASTLVTALTAAWANAFTVTFSSITNKFTISGTLAFTFDFASFTTATTTQFAMDKWATVLGFQKGINTLSGTSITSTLSANVGGEDYLYLRSNLGGALYESVYKTEDVPGDNDIIARIPINVNRNEIIQWLNPRREFFTYYPQNQTRYVFWFTFRDSKTPVEFNGQPFSLKIGLMTSVKNSVTIINSNQTGYAQSRPSFIN